jgi:hypothetical protein
LSAINGTPGLTPPLYAGLKAKQTQKVGDVA